MLSKYSEKIFILFLSLVLCLLLYTRLSYIHIPFERDEGEYAYAGSLLLHGHLPYQEAYNMKFPGSYFMYALMMKMGGETTEAIRTGVCLIVLLVAFMVGCVAWLMTNSKSTAAVAAVVFFAINNTMGEQALMANSEHFVNLFMVSGLLLLFLYLRNQNKPFMLFFSGALLGASVIMKQYAYPFCVFGLIVLLAHLRGTQFKQKVKIVLTFAVGGLLPVALLLFWVLSNGLWEKFKFLTIDYAYAYVGIGHSKIGGIISLVLIICLSISIFILKARNTRIILGWSIVSIIALATGLYFRPHYFILVLPAVAVIVGYIYYQVGLKFNFSVAQVMMVGLFSLFYAINGHDQFTRDANAVYRDNYPNEIFADMPEVAKRINTLIPPGDKLSLFGNEPEILFYSHHISASGYIYNCPLFEPQKYAGQMTNEYIRQVESNPSRLFVYSTISLWPENPAVFEQFNRWWKGYSQKYSLKGVYVISKENKAIYRNEEELKTDSSWRSNQHLELWLRKD